jgi:hypothetical protein
MAPFLHSLIVSFLVDPIFGVSQFYQFIACAEWLKEFHRVTMNFHPVGPLVLDHNRRIRESSPVGPPPFFLRVHYRDRAPRGTEPHVALLVCRSSLLWPVGLGGSIEGAALQEYYIPPLISLISTCR